MSIVHRPLKNPAPGCSKRSRCEAREKSTSVGVFTDTLERGDRAQRSRWAFFNGCLLSTFGCSPGSGFDESASWERRSDDSSKDNRYLTVFFTSRPDGDLNV